MVNAVEDKRTNDKLGFAAYGAVAAPLALLGVTFYVYIPKLYSSVLDLKTVGLIILISRLWDALTDPIVGLFSDSTTSVHGRRRPWIAASAFPLCGAFILLFCPTLVRPTPATFATLSFLFFLAWTTFTIPYESLGAELCPDYHKRSLLFAFRDGALIVGTLLAATIPWLLGVSDLSFSGWGALSLGYSVLLIATTALMMLFVRERATLTSGVRAGEFWGLLDNLPFRYLLIAYTISSFGAALPATLILFYVEDVLNSSNAAAYLALYFLAGVIFLPLWLKAARRYDKANTWLAAMAVNAGAFLGVFFLGPGDTVQYAILVAVSGIGYGASLSIPSSMQADVIDFDELTSGRRREGLFISLWSIAKKTSAAAGAGIALFSLGWFGYDPTSEVHSGTSIWLLKFLYALAPSLCYLAAIAIAKSYPITEAEHRQVILEIATRNG